MQQSLEEVTVVSYCPVVNKCIALNKKDDLTHAFNILDLNPTKPLEYSSEFPKK